MTTPEDATRLAATTARLDVTVHCLVCDKELDTQTVNSETEYLWVNKGGTLTLTFGPHSAYNQYDNGVRVGTPRNRDDWLVSPAVSEIEAYLCDACFRARAHRIRGFNDRVTRTRTEATFPDPQPPPPAG